MTLSVIIPTHNPDSARLVRVLSALRGQDLPPANWELIIIDNASKPALSSDLLQLEWHPSHRVVQEESLGLTPARMRGFREARGDLFVLVDDDNLLQADFLTQAGNIAARRSDVGVFGGKSLPEFESTPSPWLTELFGVLALRDDGDEEKLEAWENRYPSHAPIGAGMVIRRSAALEWVEQLERDPRRRALDRTGSQLVSGGDNDIVITVMKSGLKMGYFPSLVLTHLIPAARCEVNYLSRLSRTMSRSWMRVLSIHGINPWPGIPAWSVPLRQAKAWFTHRAWSGPAARIRWAAACGHFEGRA